MNELDYDGIVLLEEIDRELGYVEAFLGEFVRTLGEEHLARIGLDSLLNYHNGLLDYYDHHTIIMEQRLEGLINRNEPILRHVFGILPSNGLGARDIRRGFGEWLERNDADYPLFGGLRQAEEPVAPRFTYQGNVHPRDLFEGEVQQPVRPQMRADAQPYYPAGQGPYDDPVAGDYYQPQQPLVPQPYPQQVYTTQHIQWVPGVQPYPQQTQNPHTIVVVQPPYGHNVQPMVPGYGYPQQQYVEPCIHPQQLDPDAQFLLNQRINPGLRMPTPVRPVAANFFSNPY